ASLRQRLAGGEHAVVDLPELAASGEDEHDAMTLRRGAGDGPAGLDGLVVGVGVEAHEGSGHPPMVARRSAVPGPDVWDLGPDVCVTVCLVRVRPDRRNVLGGNRMRKARLLVVLAVLAVAASMLAVAAPAGAQSS